jgi:hypothetical protein
MISAFGVDHGGIEKAFNPVKALKGLRSAKGGAHAGQASPTFDQLAAKTGMKTGGAHRAPGSHKGSLKAKSFNPFGRGGARRA